MADAVRRPPTSAIARAAPSSVHRAQCRSVPDGDPHAARSAGDDLLGGVDVIGVEVRHLALGDLANLRPADRGNLRRVRLARALLDAGRLEDQSRGRRSLGDEGERAVLVDGDLDRYDVAALLLRCGVVLLAELHDVDAVLAERGPDRRRRRRGTGLDLQLDESGDLLLRRHVSDSLVTAGRQILLTWLKY